MDEPIEVPTTTYEFSLRELSTIFRKADIFDADTEIVSVYNSGVGNLIVIVRR